MRGLSIKNNKKEIPKANINKYKNKSLNKKKINALK